MFNVGKRRRDIIGVPLRGNIMDFAYAQLLDVYGALLTERQREIMNLHFNLDLSFSEIADETGMTRQGAADSVSKSKRQLEEFEQRLGFIGALSSLKSDVLKWAEGKNLSEEDISALKEILKR